MRKQLRRACVPPPQFLFCEFCHVICSIHHKIFASFSTRPATKETTHAGTRSSVTNRNNETVSQIHDKPLSWRHHVTAAVWRVSRLQNAKNRRRHGVPRYNGVITLMYIKRSDFNTRTNATRKKKKKRERERVHSIERATPTRTPKTTCTQCVSRRCRHRGGRYHLEVLLQF